VNRLIGRFMHCEALQSGHASLPFLLVTFLLQVRCRYENVSRRHFSLSLSLTSCTVEFRMSRDVSWQPSGLRQTTNGKLNTFCHPKSRVSSRFLPCRIVSIRNFAKMIMIRLLPQRPAKQIQSGPGEAPPAGPEKPTIPPRNV
jgi:hypothetical protein